MVFIISLYLLADVLQHKGQARVLFPLQYPVFKTDVAEPGNNTLINKDKHWLKAVNTVNRMYLVNKNSSGFECDVYFNIQQNEFEVHHDPDKATGTMLQDLLKHYQQQNLTASLWLDFKNLNSSNAFAALSRLMQLRKDFNLKDKILVESSQANILTAFADSGFFTSYYTPMFNPYKINDAEKKIWADSIAASIKNSKVDALSGYYFQYPYLHHYFPNYKILTWVETDKLSLVNWLFTNKIAADKAIFISLNP